MEGRPTGGRRRIAFTQHSPQSLYGGILYGVRENVGQEGRCSPCVPAHAKRCRVAAQGFIIPSLAQQQIGPEGQQPGSLAQWSQMRERHPDARLPVAPEGAVGPVRCALQQGEVLLVLGDHAPRCRQAVGLPVRPTVEQLPLILIREAQRVEGIFVEIGRVLRARRHRWGEVAHGHRLSGRAEGGKLALEHAAGDESADCPQHGEQERQHGDGSNAPSEKTSPSPGRALAPLRRLCLSREGGVHGLVML